jgi:hypothetical protein
LLAWRAGDRAAAAAGLRSSLHRYGSLGHVWGLALGLYLAAELAAGRGRQERAVSLLATSAALRDAIGAAQLPFIGVWIDDMLARARATLAEAVFAEAWRAGQAQQPATAMTFALAETDIAAGSAATPIPAVGRNAAAAGSRR